METQPRSADNKAKHQAKLRFEECTDEDFGTYAVRMKGRGEDHRRVANFVLEFDYLLKGQKGDQRALSGWNSTIRIADAETTSIFIPCTVFASESKLLEYLQRNTEFGALLWMSCDKNTLKAFVDWKQKEFAKSDPENKKVRYHVLSLGIQPDKRTLVMGKTAVGIFECKDDGSSSFRALAESECAYRWLDQLGLANFDTDLFCEDSGMFDLIREHFGERHLENFCIVLGFILVAFYKDFIRDVLKCANPIPMLTGPTGCGKTRTFEFGAAVLGHLESSPHVWKWLNFISTTVAGIDLLARSHPFSIMLSDAKEMAELETVFKQYFDGASTVNNRGIKESSNGLIIACNPEPMQKMFKKIEKSTCERVVILVQPPFKKKISDEAKTAFNTARAKFSGHLPALVDPSDQSEMKANMQLAFARYKSSFSASLSAKGVEDQAARLSENYAVAMALGASVHCHFDRSTLPSQILQRYETYFERDLLDMVMSLQVNQEDLSGTDVPGLFCRIIAKYIMIEPNWHMFVSWNVVNSKFPVIPCMGVRTADVFERLEKQKEDAPELAGLLRDLTLVQVKLWMKEKGADGRTRAEMGATVNQFCNARPRCGDVIPVREFGDDWTQVTQAATEVDHDPLIKKCAYHARKTYRENLSKAHDEIIGKLSEGSLVDGISLRLPETEPKTGSGTGTAETAITSSETESSSAKPAAQLNDSFPLNQPIIGDSNADADIYEGDAADGNLANIDLTSTFGAFETQDDQNGTRNSFRLPERSTITAGPPVPNERIAGLRPRKVKAVKEPSGGPSFTSEGGTSSCDAELHRPAKRKRTGNRKTQQ